jgi:hypothetical protein
VIVPLGGIEGIDNQTVELTAAWLKLASGNLRVRIEHDVANVYRLARLVLDRGGEFDPAPGTINFDERTRGDIRRLSQVGLRDDAQLHIDHVVLIGGGTKMPLVATMFEEIFGSKVIQPELIGTDRSEAVALGLSRPKPARMANLRFPSWGLSAMFQSPDGEPDVPLYEPFAPTFHILAGETASYSHEACVPVGATAVALAFRPIGGAQGTQWPFVTIPATCGSVRLALDLFGQLRFSTDSAVDLYERTRPKPVAPWSPAEASQLAGWLPPWKMRPDWWVDIPMYDPAHEK